MLDNTFQTGLLKSIEELTDIRRLPNIFLFDDESEGEYDDFDGLDELDLDDQRDDEEENLFEDGMYDDDDEDDDEDLDDEDYEPLYDGDGEEIADDEDQF